MQLFEVVCPRCKKCVFASVKSRISNCSQQANNVNGTVLLRLFPTIYWSAPAENLFVRPSECLQRTEYAIFEGESLYVLGCTFFQNDCTFLWKFATCKY